MLNSRLYIGTYLGVPVYLHSTWFIMLAFFLMLTTFSAFITILAMFGIILLHEYGHCLAAKYLNYEVIDITMLPMGGVARISIPVRPAHEIFVALAGPFVNVLLIPILYLFSYENDLMYNIHMINIVILVFNLMPAFPLDGGRVFRALCCFVTNRYYATLITGRIGQFLAVLLIGWCAINYDLMGIMVGIFLIIVAQQEISEEKRLRIDFGTDNRDSWTIVLENQRAIEEYQERRRNSP